MKRWVFCVLFRSTDTEICPSLPQRRCLIWESHIFILQLNHHKQSLPLVRPELWLLCFRCIRKYFTVCCGERKTTKYFCWLFQIRLFISQHFKEILNFSWQLFFVNTLREMDIKDKICMGCQELLFFFWNDASWVHKNKYRTVLRNVLGIWCVLQKLHSGNVPRLRFQGRGRNHILIGVVQCTFVCNEKTKADTRGCCLIFFFTELCRRCPWSRALKNATVFS